MGKPSSPSNLRHYRTYNKLLWCGTVTIWLLINVGGFVFVCIFCINMYIYITCIYVKKTYVNYIVQKLYQYYIQQWVPLPVYFCTSYVHGIHMNMNIVWHDVFISSEPNVWVLTRKIIFRIFCKQAVRKWYLKWFLDFVPDEHVIRLCTDSYMSEHNRGLAWIYRLPSDKSVWTSVPTIKMPCCSPFSKCYYQLIVITMI